MRLKAKLQVGCLARGNDSTYYSLIGVGVQWQSQEATCSPPDQALAVCPSSASPWCLACSHSAGEKHRKRSRSVPRIYLRIPVPRVLMIESSEYHRPSSGS